MVITGTTASESLQGSDDADTLFALGGDDILYGFGGDDVLLGEAGDDLIYGGSGNDLMYGDAGQDMYFGQSGNDTVRYLDSVLLDLRDPGNSTGDAAGDYFLSVEVFQLGNFDDIAQGSLLGETIEAGGGNDFLYGNAGSDDLFGQDGVDQLHGGDGDDGLYGGKGDDVLFGGAGGDRLHGGAGIDSVSYVDATTGLTLDFRIPVNHSGEAAGDQVRQIEIIFGSDHDDYIRLSGSLTTANGRWGNDMIFGTLASDTIMGGFGNNVLYGGKGSDFLLSQGAGDMMFGGDGNDSLNGGTSGDIFVGGTGADYQFGDTGFDISVLESNSTLNLADQTLNRGGALGDRFVGVEQFDFWGGINRYFGGTQDATVTNNSAALIAVAGTAAESFEGRFGQMTVSYAASSAGISLSDDGLRLKGLGGLSAGDLIAGAERLILSRFADILDQTLAGSHEDKTMQIDAAGGADDLTLWLTLAGTEVYGGLGDDTVAGNVLNHSTINLGDGADEVDLLFRGNLGLSAGNGDDLIEVTQEHVIWVATLSADLGAGNDTITAASFSSFLSEIYGESGEDVMTLGLEHGVAYGGEGNDMITLDILRDGSADVTLSGGSGNDTLELIATVPGVGGTDNAAWMNGGAGDDSITGLASVESVNENYVFEVGWGDDTIVGFDSFAMVGHNQDYLVFVADAASGLDVQSDLSVTGDATHTVVTFGSDSITLLGVDVADFFPNDVVFT